MILARSPYIVTIDEPLQESTRIELFLWNGLTPCPPSPSYSLSKNVPSINNLTTYYNVSPFIREYFDFTQSSPYFVGAPAIANQYVYANVRIITYYTVDAVEITLNDDTFIAVDGFGYFEDLYNYIGQNILLTDLSIYGGSNIYYYPCISATGLQEAGLMTIYTELPTATSDWFVTYTNLETNATTTITLTNSSIVNIRRVYSAYESDGNKVEIGYVDSLDPLNPVIIGSYNFVPQCECKYDIVTIDFVNRWGGWQREFFYKASTESVEMENNKFKMNPVPFPDYRLRQPQFQTFNTNGKRTIKTNTGWVNENYKQVIEELLLSEVIRVNGSPAMLKTKSVDKIKHINQKTINYQMEFEMAYDIINSIS